jgi:Amt family ammonium transporter
MSSIDQIEQQLNALLTKVDGFATLSGLGRHLTNPDNTNYDGPFSTTYGNGQCAQPGAYNTGDTAFVILSACIVLMMTIPGLGLYYSGMVKVTNVLATVMQSFTITCVVTVMYFFFGYSLSFGSPDASTPMGQSNLFIGGGDRLWFVGMNRGTCNQLATTIPESVYLIFQLNFAIITAALICGSFADRVKFSSMIVFIALWHVAVYCPIAHSNWHFQGFLNKAGVMDFAGGNVVHISSGMAGLMSTIVVGNRHGFGKERFEPHNILLTFIGASLLWVGWYGFNAGSAVAANALAGQAMLNTQIATAMSSLTWMSVEWIVKKKPSVLGMLSGAIAGLVAITPACGWVDASGAFFIGFLAGPWCYFFARVKNYAGYDDALDAFGVHATGGVLGGILTGFFANPQYFAPYVGTGAFDQAYGDNGGFSTGARFYAGVFYNRQNIGGTQGYQLATQLYGISCTILYSSVASLFLLKFVDLLMGLRVTEEEELLGLDASLHGETIVAKTHQDN